MKTKTTSFITAIIMVIGMIGILPVMTASAETYEDYEYTVLEDGNVEITKYNGSDSTVVIPDTIDEKTVVSIGEKAFKECESLTNVTIGSGVETIGEAAFYGCENLEDVYFSGTEVQWKAISIAEDNEPLLNATVHYLKGNSELKYQLRQNDDGTTDTRFILIADEDDVLTADSASVYATIDGTDTDAIVMI